MEYDAVTFDFWNTLYSDSREGFSRVTELRMGVLADVARRLGLTFTDEELAAAYQSGFQAYLRNWQAGLQFGARDQAEHVLRTLGAAETDGLLDGSVERLEELGAQADLELLPGTAAAIRALAEQGVKLGLISDTGITPGRVLTRFLERDGLLPYFDALTFSDETGFPKPDRRMFHRTLEGLGASPSRSAHVGDMPRTDIAGALGVGMKAVRMAARNDYAYPPHAHAVIRNHLELEPALTRLFTQPERP